MASQTLTLRLPDSIYQQLVELAQKSDRPLEEEAVGLINAALMTDAELVSDIDDRLDQLALLTDEELWSAATCQASENENDLIQELLEKRQRQGLTPEELEQVQVLSKHFNHIMMLRAKAAALLAERGHDISMLAEAHISPVSASMV
jgi:predicted transcriptional regulator